MSDVFNEDDAALVLELYETFNGYANCYAQIVNLDNQHCIKKLERMGVVYAFDLFPVGEVMRSTVGEVIKSTVGEVIKSTTDGRYLNINTDHPNVKAIIDAMELL
jgi:hypothetical protein